MNKTELDALKATMPWRQEQMFMPNGCLIRVIDRHGNEVPLVQMVEFIVAISERYATVGAEQK